MMSLGGLEDEGGLYPSCGLRVDGGCIRIGWAAGAATSSVCSSCWAGAYSTVAGVLLLPRPRGLPRLWG